MAAPRAAICIVFGCQLILVAVSSVRSAIVSFTPLISISVTASIHFSLSVSIAVPDLEVEPKSDSSITVTGNLIPVVIPATVVVRGSNGGNSHK